MREAFISFFRCGRQGLCECGIGALGCLRLAVVNQQLHHLAQLPGGEPYTQAGTHVRAQLRLCAGRGGKNAHGGQFAAGPIEVVALEDVAKQMRLKELVMTGANSNTGP